MPGEDRRGRFGEGSLIKSRGKLSEVPTALPADEEQEHPSPEPPKSAPTADAALDPEPADDSDELPTPSQRSKRKAPGNVRLHQGTASRFWESFLDAKARNLDLTVVDHASNLLDAALRAERRRGAR